MKPKKMVKVLTRVCEARRVKLLLYTSRVAELAAKFGRPDDSERPPLKFITERWADIGERAKDFGWLGTDGCPDEALDAVITSQRQIILGLERELVHIDKALGLHGEGRTRMNGDRLAAIMSLINRSYESRSYGVP